MADNDNLEVDDFKTTIPPNSPNDDDEDDENEQEEIPTFQYRETDFITINCDVDAPFDKLLRTRWESAMKSGAMNYNIENTESLKKKIISPFKYKFVATLLEGRGPGKRRLPQTMTALRMPFNENEFNFTKVNRKEYLFHIKATSTDFNPIPEATILINKSPIEYCSSLMVPFLNDRLPQVLNEQALYLAISMVALSDFRSLRLGFNSLGSMASVNHLHWHIFYLNHDLAIEELTVIDFVLQDWPVPALVFEINELNDDNILLTIKDVMRIVEYCLDDGQLCHNLFITRTICGSIKIFLWILKPRWGLKDNANLNVAFCELSGYFMCKTLESFNTIDEQKCLETLNSVQSKHENVLHLLQ